MDRYFSPAFPIPFYLHPHYHLAWPFLSWAWSLSWHCYFPRPYLFDFQGSHRKESVRTCACAAQSYHIIIIAIQLLPSDDLLHSLLILWSFRYSQTFYCILFYTASQFAHNRKIWLSALWEKNCLADSPPWSSQPLVFFACTTISIRGKSQDVDSKTVMSGKNCRRNFGHFSREKFLFSAAVGVVVFVVNYLHMPFFSSSS